MYVNINRRDKYEICIAYSPDCPEWKWKIQNVIDFTWNKFIHWNPLLNDVVKLDTPDTFSVDYTLSKLAVPLLIELHKSNHGFFLVENGDVPKELRTDGEEYDEEKYNWVMDEIIWCLNEIQNDEANAPEYPKGVEVPFMLNDVEHTPEEKKRINTWLKETKKYEKRIDKGCRLFGKYFRNLWD